MYYWQQHVPLGQFQQRLPLDTHSHSDPPSYPLQLPISVSTVDGAHVETVCALARAGEETGASSNPPALAP